MALQTLNQIANEVVGEAADAAGAKFANAIRPIYGTTPRNSFVHIGSSVLIRHRNKKLLVTAAHVVDQRSWTDLFVLADELISFSGLMFITASKLKDRDDDTIDFAILPIDGSELDVFGDDDFVDSADVDLSNTYEPGAIFMLYGFPNSKNKVNDKSLKITPFRTRYSGTRLPFAEVPSRFSRHGDVHILVRRDKRYALDSAGNKIHRLGARGTSGGAMISLGNLAPVTVMGGGRKPEPKLAGIMIEDSVEAGCLVATRIGPILDAFDRAAASAAT